ncbi:MAG: hypothetical protein ACI90V_008765 [Bacillariaceae sp.]|jgi:hypothetical protein
MTRWCTIDALVGCDVDASMHEIQHSYVSLKKFDQIQHWKEEKKKESELTSCLGER